MNKGSSFSNRKSKDSPLRSNGDYFGATKSHIASTHLKTSQDLYSNIYRLPLKEIIQQRRQEGYSQKKTQKNIMETHKYSDFKTKQNAQQSSKKLSMKRTQQSTIQLKTDRPSQQFLKKSSSELKRMKTELQNVSQQDHMQTVQHRRSSTRIDRQTSRKQYISIKLQDMMALLASYSKLKTKNSHLVQELNFYYKQLQQIGVDNSVIKVLQQ